MAANDDAVRHIIRSYHIHIKYHMFVSRNRAGCTYPG